LPVVVRAAEGSLRDALSVLDTTIAYGQGRLEAATVAALLGTTAPAEIRAFCQALLAREPGAALETIDRSAREGEDLGAIARDAIEVLRRVLVLKAAPSAQLADLAPVEANTLRKLGESASLDEVLYALRALMEADALMRESPHPRVELEVAVVRATRRPSPEAIEDVLRRVDEAQARLAQYVPAAPPAAAVQESFLSERAAPAPAPRPTLPAPRPAGPAAVPAASAAPAPRPTPAPSPASTPSPAPAPAAAPTPEASELTTSWQRVVEEVMRKKPMLGAVLAQATPVQVSAGELTIAVAGNHFHRDLLADRANRDLVLAAVRRWLRDVERFTVAEGPGPGDIAGHPAVQAAITEFEGEVVTVRPRPREGDGQ
jgi:DNA polymerase-3 subunit gamma/tau